jgi:peptidoglycan/LPS O-acetylase OafA/YrhL
MKNFRLFVLIAVVLAVVLLAALLSHGFRVRLIWGSSGFVAGVLCGALLAVEVQHRLERRQKH